MNKCLLAAILFLSTYGLTQNNPDSPTSETPVFIVVYNYAQVPQFELSMAEKTTQRILEAAGVRTLWVLCKPSGSFRQQEGRCAPSGQLQVRVNILRQPAPQTGTPDSVFGYAVTEPEAIGPASYVFYSRISELAETSEFSHALILGQVLAHEFGHLFLGSNSHSASGIMSAVLNREKLKAGSMGQLGFSREQAKKMQSMIAHAKLARWMVNAGALPGSDQGAMVSLNDQLLGPQEQNWKK